MVAESSISDVVYQSKLQEADKLSKARAVNPKLLSQLLIKHVPEYTPKKYKGTLDAYERFDVTVKIGTEFKKESGIQLSKLTDDQVQDLAVLVSQRGVVFLRDQDLTVDQQRDFGRKLADPSYEKGLHTHPAFTEVGSEFGDEISIITSELNEYYLADPEYASRGWHSDITFETTPSNYALLKVIHPSETGGDTLWASGYAAYDKLSPSYRKFLEGLSAYHTSFNEFNGAAAFRQIQLRTDRGGKNQGLTLDAVHPIIRTNPVTGLKSIYVNKNFTKRIIELTKPESDRILEHLFNLVTDNHDIQVRFRWNKNDIAIWDNRSTYHTATLDYGKQFRKGIRVVPLGEIPFFDPKSKSEEEAQSVGK
ncbi:hypothetical protein HK096_000932 [Nowakowskiella sp. JEL0078]|nr:hypothetical protein HK096_000932 [Nowakowskiella sp. JEL0078]